jgi:hypothetical protein
MDYHILRPSLKKRKIDTNYAIKFVTSIIELHPSSKKWLVEWSDKTRTWETYDIVKELGIFQEFLSKTILKPKPKPKLPEIPSYIS